MIKLGETRSISNITMHQEAVVAAIMKDEVDMAIKSVTVVPNRLSNNGNEGPIRYRQAVMSKMITKRSKLTQHPEVLSSNLRLLTLTSI